MKHESTGFGLGPEQLERLFNIGRETKKDGKRISANQKKNELLHHWLSQTLPLDKSQIDVLSSALGQLCHSISLLAGDTVIDLLQNPSTEISVIEKIKRYGKDLSAKAESKDEHEVATAIYYAAIAHALVYHDLRITQFSYKKLGISFSHLVKEKWISKDLSVLFKIAGKYCREKA